MTKRVVGIAVILIAIAGGAWLITHQGTVHKVKIIKGTTPRVSVDPVRMSRRDEVEWDADGEDFDVTFTNSPFARRDFHKGNPKSGKPNQNQPQGTYKYSIKIGGVEVDPSVIIQD